LTSNKPKATFRGVGSTTARQPTIESLSHHNQIGTETLARPSLLHLKDLRPVFQRSLHVRPSHSDIDTDEIRERKSTNFVPETSERNTEPHMNTSMTHRAHEQWCGSEFAAIHDGIRSMPSNRNALDSRSLGPPSNLGGGPLESDQSEEHELRRTFPFFLMDASDRLG
jgi:hypothetical protein